MAEKITHSICVGGPLTIHTTEDGVIRRVRPIVFDETDPAGWVIKARGKEFTPQRKTTLSLLGFTEKDRTYSYDRIKYPMIREDFVETPDGQNRNTENRGKSGYRRACLLYTSSPDEIHRRTGGNGKVPAASHPCHRGGADARAGPVRPGEACCRPGRRTDHL